MGNYITVTSIVRVLGTPRLAILCPTASGGVSTTAVDSLIEYAEAEVNSIIGPGFTVPRTQAETVVKWCALQIAIDFAYRGITEFRDVQGNTPTHRDYDRAVKALQDMRSGKRDLGNETAKSVVASAGTVYYSYDPFIVNRTEPDGLTGGF